MADLVRILVINAVAATVIGGFAALVWRVTRRAPIARCLWLVAMLKLVTPPLLDVETALIPSASGETAAAAATSPFLPVFVPVTDGMAPAGATNDGSAVASQTATTSGPVIPWITLWVLWASGAVGASVLGMWRLRRCRSLVARASPAPPAIADLVASVANQIGLPRAPRACVVTARVSPFVWAFARSPVVVLPRDLIKGLSPEERRAVVAHELAHLARRDHVVRWLELIVATVHWWNPAAWWIRRRLHEVEELCCDARAVDALSQKARHYGRAILKATEFLDDRRDAVPFGATGLLEASTLKRRIVMIATERLHHRMAWHGRLAIALCAFAVLPFGLRAQECQCQKAKQKPAKATLLKTGEALAIVGEGGTRIVRLTDLKATGGKGVTVHSGDILRVIELDESDGTIVLRRKKGGDTTKGVIRLLKGDAIREGDGTILRYLTERRTKKVRVLPEPKTKKVRRVLLLPKAESKPGKKARQTLLLPGKTQGAKSRYLRVDDSATGYTIYKPGKLDKSIRTTSDKKGTYTLYGYNTDKGKPVVGTIVKPSKTKKGLYSVVYGTLDQPSVKKKSKTTVGAGYTVLKTGDAKGVYVLESDGTQLRGTIVGGAQKKSAGGSKSLKALRKEIKELQKRINALEKRSKTLQ